MRLKNQKGVSLITVLITVIVIIILTTIAMSTSSEIPDDANYAKYAQEIKGVQSGIENIKVKNSKKGNTEEKLTAGFEKVYLEEAPTEFASFGDVYEPTYGYLVRLDKIDYNGTTYGNAYDDYSSGDTLTFGDKNCDVFVFDANWTVYYVKGLKYDGSMNYTL